MAKDFAEIKKRLDYYVDDTVSDPTAIMLFNQCSEDLSLVAGYAKTSTAEYDPQLEGEIRLPTDWIEMIELQIKRITDDGYYRVMPLGLVAPEDIYDSKAPLADGIAGYEMFGDNIEILPKQEIASTIRLRYYAALPQIASLGEAPIVKVQYHDAYALYAAAKYYQNYQDELKAKADYFEEYMIKKLELKNETDRLRSKTKSRTVYQLRSWT